MGSAVMVTIYAASSSIPATSVVMMLTGLRTRSVSSQETAMARSASQGGIRMGTAHSWHFPPQKCLLKCA